MTPIFEPKKLHIPDRQGERDFKIHGITGISSDECAFIVEYIKYHYVVCMLFNVKDTELEEQNATLRPLLNTIEPIYDKPDESLCHNGPESIKLGLPHGIKSVKTMVVKQEDLCNHNQQLHFMVHS
jgi:hypothetical protein